MSSILVTTRRDSLRPFCNIRFPPNEVWRKCKLLESFWKLVNCICFQHRSDIMTQAALLLACVHLALPNVCGRVIQGMAASVLHLKGGALPEHVMNTSVVLPGRN